MYELACMAVNLKKITSQYLFTFVDNWKIVDINLFIWNHFGVIYQGKLFAVTLNNAAITNYALVQIIHVVSQLICAYKNGIREIFHCVCASVSKWMCWGSFWQLFWGQTTGTEPETSISRMALVCDMQYFIGYMINHLRFAWQEHSFKMIICLFVRLAQMVAPKK